MNKILEVSDLHVKLGPNDVLQGLGFAVVEGDSLAILGPNGSGKTVLFKALIGALPYRGTIAWGPGVRIGYVPQKLDLERDLPITGEDFLHAKARVLGCGAGETERVVDLVGITRENLEKAIGTLSGGQFQRLLLAFAMLGRPNVLLFDELTAGIDERGGERIYEKIHHLKENEKLTILLISHELNLVHRYATNVFCLARGRAWFGPPSAVLTPDTLESLYDGTMQLHVHDEPGS